MRKLLLILICTFLVACGSEEKEEVTYTFDDPIAQDIADHIVERHKGDTEILDIVINPNLGSDIEGLKVALVYLKFKPALTENTTKEEIELFSNGIGNLMTDKYDEVSDLTVFWEVPYHKEDNNIVKHNYGRDSRGMYHKSAEYFPPFSN